MTRNEQLNALFDRWQRSLPDEDRSKFVRDGIVCEPTYDDQPRRLLFVVAEANATFQPVDECGRDLRMLYRRDISSKLFNRRLSRWTRFLLDGEVAPVQRTPRTVWHDLRRIATMNLKKVGGTGSAKTRDVLEHAWRDREFILEQVHIIEPDLLIACGDHVRAVILKVLRGNRAAPRLESEPIRWQGIHVLPSKHPSAYKVVDQENEPLYAAFRSVSR